MLRCLSRGTNLSERNRFSSNVNAIEKLRTALERDPENKNTILGSFVGRYIGTEAVLKLDLKAWDKLFWFVENYEEKVTPEKPMRRVLLDVIEGTAFSAKRLSHGKRELQFQPAWHTYRSAPRLESKSIQLQNVLTQYIDANTKIDNGEILAPSVEKIRSTQTPIAYTEMFDAIPMATPSAYKQFSGVMKRNRLMLEFVILDRIRARKASQ